MTQNSTRSMFEIKRETERARGELAVTVDQLRASVSSARQRLAPDSIKSELSVYAREQGQRLVDAARRNPTQAAAIGALAAWPALAIARAIPLPIALIGAGLFLSGTGSGRKLAQSAADRASDLAGEVNRQTHEIAGNSADALGAASDRIANVATRVADEAKATVAEARATLDDALHDASPLASQMIDASAETLRAASQSASRMASDVAGRITEASDDAVLRGRETLEGARARAVDSTQTLVAWAKDNPALVAALGLIAGGFLASALPATAAERSVAGVVGVGVRTGLRVAAAQGVASAAGAAVRAATAGLQTGENASETGHAATGA